MQHEQFANIIRAEVRRRLAAEGRTFFRITSLLSARDEIALSRNCSPLGRERGPTYGGFICVVFRRGKQLPGHQKRGGERRGEERCRRARGASSRVSIETRLLKNLARPRKSLGEQAVPFAGHDHPPVFDSCRVNVDFEIVAALVNGKELLRSSGEKISEVRL